MSRRGFYLFLGFLAVAAVGYWVARSAAPAAAASIVSRDGRPPRLQSVFDNPEAERAYRRSERDGSHDPEARKNGAIEGQRELVFRDRQSVEDFLKRAGDRLRVLGRIDGLNALHVGFSHPWDLEDLLTGDEEMALIFPVTYPENDSIAAQAGAVPFGASLLEWLGITGDNSEWGRGISIAILDTGVDQHSSFSSAVHSLIFGDSAKAGDVHGHGTAVASMILGNNSQVPGVAPGATVVSIRIADEQGYSNSFTLAQGIMAAADAGVAIINISMGSQGDSSVVRRALEYAHERGILVVASTGNQGYDQVSFPAGNDNVIAVGAVDRANSHLIFSNTGDQIALGAPGYGLNAGWVNNAATSVSGTSFSAPIVSGLIAATMTHGGSRPLSAAQALQVIYENTNESAAPGYDRWTGYGVPDMGRVLNAGTPGIYDGAIASNWVTNRDGHPELQVVVENRGTETLVNAGVEVNSPAGRHQFNVPALSPGNTQIFSIPLPQGADAMYFDSRIDLSGGQTDSKRSNDRRADHYVSPQSR